MLAIGVIFLILAFVALGLAFHVRTDESAALLAFAFVLGLIVAAVFLIASVKEPESQWCSNRESVWTATTNDLGIHVYVEVCK